MSDISSDCLIRGMVCLSIALGFEEDRARFGLSSAVERLRNALAENHLVLPGDEELFAAVLKGSISSQELAEQLCSMRRMGVPGGGTH